MRHIIQVAGIIDEEEARLLINAQVDWLGFPLRLDFHQPDLSETEAAKIIQSLPTHVQATLITYLTRAEEILTLCHKLGTRGVQLHGAVSGAELAQLKTMDASLFLIKSLIVGKETVPALLQSLRDMTPYIDAFLLDTFDPGTGATGATGKTHDWQVSRQLVAFSPRPVILAGGLSPENVSQAIRQVQPAGVDVHTGVEGGNGRKDKNKVAAFVSRSRETFAQLAQNCQG